MYVPSRTLSRSDVCLQYCKMNGELESLVFLSLILFLSVYLSVHLSVHLSVYLSICHYIHISICVSTYLFRLSLSVSLSLTISLYPYLSLSLSLSKPLSLYLSLYLSSSISLYLYLSLSLFHSLSLSLSYLNTPYFFTPRHSLSQTLSWLQSELPKHGFQFRTLLGPMSMSSRSKALADFQVNIYIINIFIKFNMISDIAVHNVISFSNILFTTVITSFFESLCPSSNPL